MNDVKLEIRLNSILEEFDYLYNAKLDQKFNKKEVFNCLICLQKIDDLEEDYLTIKAKKNKKDTEVVAKSSNVVIEKDLDDDFDFSFLDEIEEESKIENIDDNVSKNADTEGVVNSISELLDTSNNQSSIDEDDLADFSDLEDCNIIFDNKWETDQLKYSIPQIEIEEIYPFDLVEFENLYNTIEIDDFILKLEQIIKNSLLDKTIFSPDDYIRCFNIIDFDGEEFLVIKNPFTQENIRIKTNLYIIAIQENPLITIWEEVDAFRDTCLYSYSLQKDIDKYNLRFSHYLALIEKNLILQEKIIRGFINICKEKEKEKKWYENFDKEELEEYEARLNILIILQQLFEDFSTELWPKIRQSISLKTFNLIREYTPNRLCFFCHNARRGLFVNYRYSSILFFVGRKSRRKEEQGIEVFTKIEGPIYRLFIWDEKYESNNLYNFEPRILDDIDLDFICEAN